MKDPEFLTEVKRMNVTLDTATGEELTAEVAKLTKLDPALKAKLRTILFE